MYSLCIVHQRCVLSKCSIFPHLSPAVFFFYDKELIWAAVCPLTAVPVWPWNYNRACKPHHRSSRGEITTYNKCSQTVAHHGHSGSAALAQDVALRKLPAGCVSRRATHRSRHRLQHFHLSINWWALVYLCRDPLRFIQEISPATNQS